MRRIAPFVLLLCLVAPASAQIAGRHGGGPTPPRNLFFDDGQLPGPGPARDVRDARRQIDRAREAGLISRREAKALRREARLIARATERYGIDGLSASERRELRIRAGVLRDSATRPPRAADTDADVSEAGRTPN